MGKRGWVHRDCAGPDWRCAVSAFPWGHESRHCARCGKAGPRVWNPSGPGYIHAYCRTSIEARTERKRIRDARKRDFNEAAEQFAADKARYFPEPTDDPCPDCGGYGERYDHAADCYEDSCALNGDIDSCNGQVIPCHCASPSPSSPS